MHDEPRDIEALLRTYRPIGPSEDLRARILGREVEAANDTVRRPVRRWIGWAGPIAAMLLLSIALNFVAGRVERKTTALLEDPARARRERAMIAQVTDDPAMRRYLAFALAVEREGAAINPRRWLRGTDS